MSKNLTANQTELAGVLGLSTRRVRQLVGENVIPKPASGRRYDLSAAVQAYIEYLKGTAQSAPDTSTQRLRDAKAREIELKIARQDRLVIDLVEAEDALDQQSGKFLEVISGLLSKITRNQRERERIEKICDGQRNWLAAEFEKVAESTRTEGENL